MYTHFLELIRKTSTQLPVDVLASIKRSRNTELAKSPARAALDDVLANCQLANETSRPICQDTGTNIWYVHSPANVSEASIHKAILAATRKATKLTYLRPNSVDPITGKNSGDNTGAGAPVIHFKQWSRKSIAADLLLKGGGCENVSIQYALPHTALSAGRDLDGIYKVVVDAVFQAQGRGCGPGILGVGIGGDRASGMIEAKEQLFRLLNDKNPDPTLAKLERKLLADCNKLEIGPMGFGGRTTALGVKIGVRHRLPASFFVSVAYMCWACRRGGVVISNDKASFSQVTQKARKYILPTRIKAQKKGR